jgi:hypothetical protein
MVGSNFNVLVPLAVFAPKMTWGIVLPVHVATHWIFHCQFRNFPLIDFLFVLELSNQSPCEPSTVGIAITDDPFYILDTVVATNFPIAWNMQEALL